MPFALGARGTLKARDGEEAEFLVSALDPPRVYADTTVLDGAELTVHHEATPIAGGCRVERDLVSLAAMLEARQSASASARKSSRAGPGSVGAGGDASPSGI